MMNKTADCRTCETMRCCLEHCCNWDRCSCGDCEMCGGSKPLDYTRKEIEGIAEEKKQLELMKKMEEEEKQRLEEKRAQEMKARKEKRDETMYSSPVSSKSTNADEEDLIPSYKKDPDYIKAMALIEETQRKNNQVLEQINQALKTASQTIKIAQETTNACDKFEQDFNKAIAGLTDKIAAHMLPSHTSNYKEHEKLMSPQVSNVNDVLKEIITKNHIVVLTGAGISAASNIPTFRGEGGYWTLRNSQEKISATEFLTHSYFLKNPEEIWRWHHEFKKLTSKNVPNASHQALADLQIFCKQNQKKLILITQVFFAFSLMTNIFNKNIDGYHVEAYEKALAKSQKNISKTLKSPVKKPAQVKKISQTTKTLPKKNLEEKKTLEVKMPAKETQTKFGFCDDVYEIHGNINYMRCDRECTTELFTGPKVGCKDDFVPKCPRCQDVARPHTLFFDESYKEEYYRSEGLLHQIENMDCLIVIGTALETNLAAKIVRSAVSNSQLVTS